MSVGPDLAVGGNDLSLLSNHLRQRLADGREAPGTLTIEGAVMLTDVVGFTNHIETVSALGRRGLEDFTSGITSYIDRMVTFVLDRGGDVLCIAGDSLLCVWEAGSDDDALREATVTAASTAVAIQKAMHDHPLAGGRTLQTRIGVDAGPLTLTVAGGADDQWELLTHGETFARVDEAERNGEPGQVTVGSAAADLLVADASLNPVGDGLFQIDHWFGTSVDRDPSTRPPVDPWALEFRRLSIAMVRVPDLAQAHPDVAQEIVLSFQRIVGRFEGLTTTVTDNKGVRLLATFGTSGRAHEDDAARTIGAIRAFKDHLAKIGTTCAAGIATGRVLHGVTGNNERRARTLAGDVINTAARLSTTAVDEVLCDQETAVAAANHYSFSVMNPIRVKGKDEPVPVFEPSEAVVSARPVRGLVRGREAEFAEVSAVLGDDVDVVYLVGEAGLGKSSMLTDLIAEGRGRGLETLVARSDAIDRSTPFLAWAPILHDVLGSLAGSGSNNPNDYVEPARSILPAELRQYAPVIPGLLGGAPDGGLIADEQRATVVPQLIVEILTAGGGPTLIVMEDAHWADSASLGVLARLVRLPDGPSVAVSMRPEGQPVVEHAVGDVGARRTSVVRLGSLPPEAVRELVADRLGATVVPEHLLDFIQDRVAGHPYFCEQLVRSLVENGTVRVDGATVVVGELDAATIPTTVERVIIGRFDLLGLDAQRCLKAAAVVGRRHHVDAVQACLDDIDVREVMGRISTDSLVEPARPNWYEFQHVIARDVVYELMTDQQRRDLHRVVARHLTQLPNPPGPATIGEHWRSGGEPASAVECFERAASDALNAGSFADSMSLLDRAAELRATNGIEPDRRRAAGSALVRARAAYYLGQLAECRHELESVIALYDAPMPSSAADHAAEHAAIEARRAAGDAAPSDVQNVDVDTMLFESYRFLVKVLFLLGESPPPIVTASLRGLELADRLGRRLEAAAMQSLVGGAYVLIGDVERYRYHANEAIAVAESAEGAPVANHVWRMVAVARAGLGNWARSLEASDRALAAMDPAGRNRDSGIWQTRAAVHLCAGDVERAPEAWRRTADIAERDGNEQLARWSKFDEIQTLVGRGDIGAASALLTETIVTLGRPTDPLGTIEYSFTLAIVRSAEGRHIEAAAAARSVIAIVTETPPSGFHFVEFCAGALEVMVAAVVGDETGRLPVDELAVAVEQGVELLDEFATIFPHVRPRVPMTRALLARATGRDDQVAEHLREAIRIASEHRLEYDTSRATVLMGELCPDEQPDLDRLEESGATLRRLGLRLWADRAQALVAR